MNKEYYKKLQQGQIILDSSEQGMPTWRSYGLEAARRMETTFNETVALDWNLSRISISTLVKQEDFENFYKDINSQYLDSAYKIPGQDKILTCDSFLACLPFIREKCLDSEKSVIGVTTPLFRYVDPKPLVIDRRIWPVVGIYGVSKRESASATMDRLYNTYKKFYDRICLPIFFINIENYGNYAKRVILPIAPIDRGELTVMATIFELSELFSQKSSVDNSLFEAGISEKNLTVFYALQAEREHITLPRSLSPIEVSILFENGSNFKELIKHFEDKKIRYSLDLVDKKTRKAKAKLAEAKGIPLIIHCKQKNNKLAYWMSFNDKIGEIEDLNKVDFLLNESDDEIRKFNQELFNQSLEGNINLINGRCQKCTTENKLLDYDYYGEIYPFKPTNCPDCGIKSRLSYYLNRNTTGTIREKNRG